jgi:endonuclease/exonuclease/phosphatase family metal-dependent hydrolase
MAEGKKGIGLGGVLLRGINWLLIIALLFSYLAQWLSPRYFWMLAFFGMAYPLLLVSNVLFVFYWIFRRRRFVIYPLITVLLGIGMLSRFVGFGSNAELMDTVSPLKVMSYNVHVFGRYIKGAQGDPNHVRDEIIKLVQQENPDILCMQEFRSVSGKKSKENNLKVFQKECDFPYHYAEKYTPGSKSFYLVIFSKYPIEYKGVVQAGMQSGELTAIYADIKVNSRTIRTYCTHLQSFQISSDTYMIKESMDQLDVLNKENQDKLTQTSKHFVNKFRVAFSKRSEQIDALLDHMDACTEPIILAGDFNDTPSSYAYSRLASELDDSFVESGSGFGRTYNGPYPSFRIDFILHSPELSAYRFNTLNVPYSDHYPIVADLTFGE